MKTVNRILPLLLLVALIQFSGCSDAVLDELNNIEFSEDFTLPGYPSNWLVPTLRIDSIRYLGDSARVYTNLFVPGLEDSSAVMHDLVLNYWDVDLSVMTSQTEIVDDTIHFDHLGNHLFVTTIQDLTDSTFYSICADHAQYVTADTVKISGSCNTFQAIE